LSELQSMVGSMRRCPKGVVAVPSYIVVLPAQLGCRSFTIALRSTDQGCGRAAAEYYLCFDTTPRSASHDHHSVVTVESRNNYRLVWIECQKLNWRQGQRETSDFHTR
jgi:hypothetical protein